MQRWQELRERYEPDRKKKFKEYEERERQWAKERARLIAEWDGLSTSAPAGSLPGEVSPDHAAAIALLKSGNPVQEMLRTFAFEHFEDEVLAECLILSLASRSVVNTNGLHVSVTGESDKGKNHAFKTRLNQVPERYRLAGRMSNKALFYIDDLAPGSVIVHDDTTLSEEMREILKGVRTSFREPFLYRTVT
ncbi:MAG: hypothetical protein NT074_03625 [Methanomicrobiales archaeon]|nr:hypothetical protein [Methanomicrobiales archaeon]